MSNAAAATDTGTGLAPEVTASIKVMEDKVRANAIVTAYCHSLSNVQIAAFPNESWYPTLKANLATAQKNASYWLTDLQPAAFSTIPQSFIDYNNIFQPATDAILRMISGISGKPTEAQRARIVDMIEAILSVLREKKDSLAKVHTDLVSFTALLQTDYTNLTTGSHAVALKKLDLDTNVVKLKAEIAALQAQAQADNKLSAWSLGGTGVSLFIGVVALGFIFATGGLAAPIVLGLAVVGAVAGVVGNVIMNNKYKAALERIKELSKQVDAEMMQAVALQTVGDSIQAIIDGNKEAKKAMTQILSSWKTLEEKLTGVLDRLKNAQDEAVKPLLVEINMEAAKSGWTQLVEYATKMQDLSLVIEPSKTQTVKAA